MIRLIRSHSFFMGNGVLIALAAIALGVKIALATVSIASDDFIFLLRNIVAGWTRSPVPWVLITGPFYQLWLSLPINHPDLSAWIGGFEPPPGPTTYALTFMIKLPILIADVICAFLVRSIVAEYRGKHDGILAAAIWLLNPYVLLTGEMDGSIELIPIALTLFSILCMKKGRISIGSLALGLGITLKLFPIILMPALGVYYLRLKRTREFLKILLSAIAGLSFYILWTSAWGVEFGYSLLFYTPFTTVASELILTPYASRIGLSTVSTLVFCFVLYIVWIVRDENLLDVVSGSLLAYMAFLDWWPQYLLCLVPFITIDLVVTRRWSRFYFVVLLLSAFFFNLIMFKFAPANSAFYIPAFTTELKTLSGFLQHVYRDPIMVLVASPILRSIFAGVAVFYCAEICVRNSPRLKALLGRVGCE